MGGYGSWPHGWAIPCVMRSPLVHACGSCSHSAYASFISGGSRATARLFRKHLTQPKTTATPNKQVRMEAAAMPATMPSSSITSRSSEASEMVGVALPGSYYVFLIYVCTRSLGPQKASHKRKRKMLVLMDVQFLKMWIFENVESLKR